MKLFAVRGAFLMRYGQTHHKPDYPRCKYAKLEWESVDG
jgi:hypothetical protein